MFTICRLNLPKTHTWLSMVKTKLRNFSLWLCPGLCFFLRPFHRSLLCQPQANHLCLSTASAVAIPLLSSLSILSRRLDPLLSLTISLRLVDHLRFLQAILVAISPLSIQKKEHRLAPLSRSCPDWPIIFISCRQSRLRSHYSLNLTDSLDLAALSDSQDLDPLSILLPVACPFFVVLFNA